MHVVRCQVTAALNLKSIASDTASISYICPYVHMFRYAPYNFFLIHVCIYVCSYIGISYIRKCIIIAYKLAKFKT